MVCCVVFVVVRRVAVRSTRVVSSAASDVYNRQVVVAFLVVVVPNGVVVVPNGVVVVL